LRRWAPTANTFTLDFGDFEDDYLVFQTTEGEAISTLIAGYIDILLKAQQGSITHILLTKFVNNAFVCFFF